MTRFAHLLALAAATSTVAAKGLHELAVAAGLQFFGTAIETNNFNDTAYMRAVNQPGEFGLLVPENSQKWESTEATQGAFAFAEPDRIANMARGNQQLFRCHTLTWHSQLPPFVANGTWTRATLTAVIQTHIATVMGHFKGRCYAWDVVNEALEEDGTFRKSVFFNTLGTDYIPISFAAAAAADPAAKLYYNDFNLEFNGRKTDGAVEVVRTVLAANAKIDGVGFQAHLTVGRTPSAQNLTNVLNRFVNLGLEVAYTELDIRHRSVPANATAREQQAKDYVSVVTSCLTLRKCVGIVLWQFTDKYSWIPGTFPGAGEACLFDQNMVPKPAYTSVSALLAAATAGPRPGNGTVIPGGTTSGTGRPMPTGGVQVPIAGTTLLSTPLLAPWVSAILAVAFSMSTGSILS